MARGIEAYFHVAVAREDRLLDVYVVTTIDGTPPAVPRESHEPRGFSRISSVQWQVAPHGDSAKPPEPPFTLGLDEFCRTLESQLDRPVVNETHLEGEFAFHAEAGPAAGNDFLERLRE